MAFIPLTEAEVEVGKPTTTDLMDKIKENFNNHEARLASAESGGNTTYPPIILRVNGNYSFVGPLVGLVKTVTNFALTITGVRLYIDRAGPSGTTECDIKVSSGGGAYTSIFTTKPSVLFSAGSDAVSTNAVLDPSKVDLASGDIVRLDTTQVQESAVGFLIRIDYTKI